eukprot:TRINITY_DN2942_c0_g1_i7.p1 TRINITY_DN2942_c0_g1~~TRINITY_DN2942_c0_g1_i7.p1  ORF type:complete len:1220 (-),score=212.02 TRINITY_DN2942_c0_g1_i7:96-3755(-)
MNESYNSVVGIISDTDPYEIEKSYNEFAYAPDSSEFSSEDLLLGNHGESIVTPAPISTSKYDRIVPHNSRFDWNQRFQDILELPQTTTDEVLSRYERLRSLGNDFIHTAKTFGKIIIEEIFVPNEEKTIRPDKQMGGIGGGPKYVYCGILFKYALDWKGIYKGDEWAMKAAGHEYRGCTAFAQCGVDDLHVPLMCIMDYRGFRLIAMSFLPINTRTMIYGSHDGGQSIFASDPIMNRKMNQVGKFLNLKGHTVGMSKDKNYFYLPTDIEGHKGHDSRYYALDFARVFPPTKPLENMPSSFLYYQFRPEFIKSYHIPLSSDAYAKFGGTENKIHNRETDEATEFLINRCAKRVARQLDEMDYEHEEALSKIPSIMHKFGVNIRYLGYVRQHVKKKSVQQLLLIEMVARVVKNEWRRKLRSRMLMIKSIAEEIYRKVTRDYFNLVLGVHEEMSPQYWDNEMRTQLIEKYPPGILPDEKDRSFDLKSEIPLDILFKRVQTLTKVLLSYEANEQFSLSPNAFEIVYPDIKRMGLKVKPMVIISSAEARALYIESTRKQKRSNTAIRLLKLSLSHFADAISAGADNKDLILNYGDALYELGKRLYGEESGKMFTEALEKYHYASGLESLYSMGITLYKCIHTRTDMDNDSLSNILQLANTCFTECRFIIKGSVRKSVSRKLSSFSSSKPKKSSRTSTFNSDFDVKLYSESILMDKKRYYRPKNTQYHHVEQPNIRVSDISLHSIYMNWGYALCEQSKHIFQVTGDRVYANESYKDAADKFYRGLKLKKTKFYQGIVEKLKQKDKTHLATIMEIQSYNSEGIITEINSNWCYHITDDFLMSVNGIFKVEKLILTKYSINDLSPESILAIAKNDDFNEIHLIECHTLVSLTMEALYEEHIRLKKISISYTSDEIHKLPITDNLEYLDITQCLSINDNHIMDIAIECPNLTHLYMRGCKISTESLIYLILRMDKITDLDISHNVGVTDEVLHTIAEVCYNVSSLDISHCTKITDNGVSQMFRECGNLTHINMMHCNITDESFIQEIDGEKKSISEIGFETLILDFCQLITDRSLKKIFKISPNLCKISLKGVPISDKCIRVLGKYCHNISVLNVGQCEISVERLLPIITNVVYLDISYSNVDDVLIRQISKQCQKLVSLNICGCKKITSGAIKSLVVDGTPLLHVVDITGCKNIAKFAKKKLNELSPEVYIINRNHRRTSSIKSKIL